MALERPDAQRRALMLAAMAAGIAPGARAQPRRLTASAGRSVSVHARVQRVFPAGLHAAIRLYTLAPETLQGWPRDNRPEELEFLLQGVRNRPELGRLTGRGNTANLETIRRESGKSSNPRTSFVGTSRAHWWPE